MKIFALLLVLLIGAPASAQKSSTLSHPDGRFVFGQISDARRDQFMLDTATGRLWQITCMQVDEKKTGMDQCGWTALAPVVYMNGKDKYGVVPLPAPMRSAK
jgi:hypothetical protein